MKRLSSTDRKALIRLASALPKGSEERKTVLAGLSRTAKNMTTVEYDQWLNHLSIGEVVEAYWTAGSGGHYSAKGRVKKVNRKSVGVELLEDVMGYSVYGSGEDTIAYPKGHIITLPTHWGDRRFKAFLMPLCP